MKKYYLYLKERYYYVFVAMGLVLFLIGTYGFLENNPFQGAKYILAALVIFLCVIDIKDDEV